MRYLSILFCFLVLNLSAQPQAPNRIDSKGNKQGSWKKYDKDVLIYEGNFKDNVPVGEFKYYHPDGKLKSITLFIQGVHQVKTTIFHPNEKKASEGHFIDQQKDGEWKYWDPDTTLIKVENYNKGKKNGAWLTYSSSTGILLEELNYRNDTLNGVAKTYYTDGVLCSTEHYISGQRNGPAESYFIDGKLSIKGSFSQGLKVGEWLYYDQQGQLRKSTEYKKGQELVTFLVFYNGKQPIKLKQDIIAYFMEEGNKVKIVLFKGSPIIITDDLYTVKEWADMLNFIPVTPSLHVAHAAIKGYQQLEDDEIQVQIEPALPYKVISRGDEAAMVKMLFARELPKLE